MAFIARVREELCHSSSGTSGEAAYELYGAALACAGEVTSRHASVAYRLLSLAKSCPERFGEARVDRESAEQFGEKFLYVLRVEHMPQNLPEAQTSEHAAALVRGAFLCRGSVSNPEKRCQFQIVMPNSASAQVVGGAMAALEAPAGLSHVRGKCVLYLRAGDRIAELLGRMGASNAYMKMESERVMKEMRSGVNRQVNCDNANIGRQQQASERQVYAIERIQRELGLEKLPDALQEIALLRLDHEHASLEELGMLCNPPTAKSGVNSRMRRILELAAKLN